MRHLVLFLMLVGFVCGAIDVENHADDVITYFVLVDQATGDRDTGVAVANLEMYYIEDQTAESADAHVGAHAAATDAHTDGECYHVGHGVYRIDWPDEAFDGGVGKRVQLTVVDGDDGAKTETLEVLLSPPSNVTQLDGSDIQQGTGHIHAFDDAGASLCPSGEPLTAQEVEDTVWDAVLTGASHNDATSAGRRLRSIAITSVLREEEQAQAGAADTITLHTGASSVNDFYANTQVIITGDTGVGQARHIHSYVGSTRVATIAPNWTTNPDATSDYVIMADSVKHVDDITDGVIAAATFAADVDAEVAAYIWDAATNAYGGAGTYGQAAEDILQDTGTTLDTLIKAIPTNTEFALRTIASDDYVVVGDTIAGVTLVTTTTTNSDLVTAATIADAVWNETSTGHTTAGYAGEQLWTDIDAILTDTAAYDTDAEYVTAIWGATMENSKTYAEVMRVMAAVLSGKSSVAAGEMSFVGIDGSTTRLTVTVSSGARTSVDAWDGS